MGCNKGGKGATRTKAGKGKGGKANGQSSATAWSNPGDSKKASKGAGQKGDSGKGSANLMSAAKLEKKFVKLEEMLGKVLQGSTAKPAKQYWTCSNCGDERCFTTRKVCHACGADRAAAGGKPGGATSKHSTDGKKAAALTPPMGMVVDSSKSMGEVPPEQVVKDTENLLKVLKLSAASSMKDLLVANLQQQLAEAKSRVLQARPLPVRLQAAVKEQEHAAAALQGANEAMEQARLLYVARQQAAAEAEMKLQEATKEVQEVQAQLGRPQLEAGAIAAVTVCLTMLKQHGLGEEKLAAFDIALRQAFAGGPVAQARPAAVATSPFAKGILPGGGSKVGVSSSPVTPFSGQGGFASQGGLASPFQVLCHSQDAEMEQSRAAALASVKERLEIQRASCAVAVAKAKELRAVVDQAEGGGEEAEQAAKQAEAAAAAEQTLVDALAGQEAEIGGEAFGKGLLCKDPRSGPY